MFDVGFSPAKIKNVVFFGEKYEKHYFCSRLFRRETLDSKTRDVELSCVPSLEVPCQKGFV